MRILGFDIGSKPPQVEEKRSKVASMMVVNPGQPVWAPHNYKHFSEESYSKNVVAYQCINMIAEAVSTVKWDLFRGETEIPEHDLLNLLARPNPQQTGRDYVMDVIGYRMIAGNSYQEKVTALGGIPRELYALRPDRMKVIPSARGDADGFEYSVGGKKRIFPARGVGMNRKCDVWHMKTFNPTDDWYGLSPVKAGAYAINQHTQAMTFMQSLLQNSAVPSGVIINEGGEMSDEAFARLQAQVEEQYSGAANAGKPFILEGNLKWQAIGFSPDDMNVIETKFSSARDICLAFGVPSLMLGIPGDNTYANYKEARQAFWEDTAIPIVNELAGAWNLWLVPDFGDGLELKPNMDHVPAIVDKMAEKWEMADKSTDLTINERRQIKGYGPIDGGNTLPTQAPVVDEVDAKAMAIIGGYMAPDEIEEK